MRRWKNGANLWRRCPGRRSARNPHGSVEKDERRSFPPSDRQCEVTRRRSARGTPERQWSGERKRETHRRKQMRLGEREEEYKYSLSSRDTHTGWSGLRTEAGDRIDLDHTGSSGRTSISPVSLQSRETGWSNGPPERPVRPQYLRSPRRVGRPDGPAAHRIVRSDGPVYPQSRKKIGKNFTKNIGTILNQGKDHLELGM